MGNSVAGEAGDYNEAGTHYEKATFDTKDQTYQTYQTQYSTVQTQVPPSESHTLSTRKQRWGGCCAAEVEEYHDGSDRSTKIPEMYRVSKPSFFGAPAERDEQDSIAEYYADLMVKLKLILQTWKQRALPTVEAYRDSQDVYSLIRGLGAVDAHLAQKYLDQRGISDAGRFELEKNYMELRAFQQRQPVRKTVC
uniref:Uncharacterized protein n=1 Tax=Noctiluca scintillans TaxID=2966 RepID=A0A7S1AAV2_NOCSC|mmetsp:Transcript_37828/g.100682  ORF Transcript_37828/g.100682 Transcript_37828/m.100682 type:complete len:194 (+) Transcript_37828:5-586(+)